MSKILAISYADSGYCRAQRWNAWSAKYIGGCTDVWRFSPNDVPEEYRTQHKEIFSYKRGGGLWLWKPYLILKALRTLREGDYLVYTDSGTLFLRNIRYLISRMEQDHQNIMVFENSTIEKCFTKRETFYLMCVLEKFVEYNQVLSGYIIFKNSEYTRRFVHEWLSFMEDERISSYKHFLPEVDEFPEFYHHREDQSVLSLLCRREGIVPYRDPSQYGSRPWEYAGQKWLIRVRDYENSNYPTIFLTFRKAHPLKMLMKECAKRVLYAMGLMSREKYLRKYKIPNENILS